MASQEIPKISFSFAITEKAGYDAKQLLGIKFSEDSVPPGKDPIAYLRERVMGELDRLTLRDQTTEGPALIVLPGYEPPAPEPEEED